MALSFGTLLGTAGPAQADSIADSMSLLSINAERSQISGKSGHRAITIPRTSDVIAFTDRPQRRAEQYSIDRLLKDWKQFGFTDVNPNAVIALQQEGHDGQWVVVLGKPRIHGANATFPIMQLRVKQAKPSKDAPLRLANGTFSNTHVFIDPTDGSSTSTPYVASTEAQQVFREFSTNPTSIGITAPLNGPVPTGKRIISITNQTDAARNLDALTLEAGRVLGWDMSSLESEVTVAGQRQTLMDAIAQRPDGIAVIGLEKQDFGDLFLAAEQAGIVIICSSCVDAPYAALKDTHISGAASFRLWGRIIAAFTATHVPATPHVQMFGLSQYEVLRLFDDSYTSNLRSFAPDSTIEYHELDFTPSQIANTYLAHPSTNMVISDLGDFALGWPAQLSGVGADPGCAPLIGGLTAGADAIRTLKAGTTNAWTGYSLPIVAYSVIDSFARYWTNTPFATNVLPSQILMPGTVNTAVFDAQGKYVGVADYVAQFKQLWGVS